MYANWHSPSFLADDGFWENQVIQPHDALPDPAFPPSLSSCAGPSNVPSESTTLEKLPVTDGFDFQDQWFPALDSDLAWESVAGCSSSAVQCPTIPSLSTSSTSKSAQHLSGRAPVISQEQWEVYRPEIQQLYMNEGMSLPDVMTIMESRHKFRPSPKMYKTQMKLWKFSKYLPKEVLSYMKHVSEEREKMNKKTEFFYNEHTYSSAEIHKRHRRLQRRKPSSATAIPTECTAPFGVAYGSPKIISMPCMSTMLPTTAMPSTCVTDEGVTASNDQSGSELQAFITHKDCHQLMNDISAADLLSPTAGLQDWHQNCAHGSLDPGNYLSEGSRTYDAESAHPVPDPSVLGSAESDGARVACFGVNTLRHTAELLASLYAHHERHGHCIESSESEELLSSSYTIFRKVLRKKVSATKPLFQAGVEVIKWFLRLGQWDTAEDMFNRIESEAKQVYSQDRDCNELVAIMISIGLLYQTERRRKDVNKWFEHARAICYKNFGQQAKLARILERASDAGRLDIKQLPPELQAALLLQSEEVC